MTEEILRSSNKKVLTIHGIPTDTYPGKDVLEHVDMIVAPYDYEGEILKRIYGIRPIIIHHGVDPLLFNNNISTNTAKRAFNLPEDKKILSWVARFDIAKKPWIFLNAISQILKDICDVIVLMFARSVNKNLFYKLQYVVNNLKMKYKNRFRFNKRWIPYIKMPLLYRASNVYISTGIGGIDLIEAVACNSIVVAEENPISREVLGSTGYYYRGVEELVESIYKAISTSREKLREVQENRIYEYKGLWNIAAKNYIERIYYKLI